MKKYYEFTNINIARNWINKNYGNFLNKIQNECNIKYTLGEALWSYTGSMSKDYNIILKFNDGNLNKIDNMVEKYYNCEDPNSIIYIFREDAKKDIKIIYNAFSSNSIADNIILFHYFDINYYDKTMLNSESFIINNFISTTMIKNTFGIKELIYRNNYNSLLVIKVKRGTPCIPIWNDPKSILREYEIILKPKSQFIVNKVKRKPFSKIKNIVECELI
ncbi:MAG TPA: hypothetical protein IAC20_04530 [Candidatus Faecisoma merdavium]|nr:hypothetical protein [Candidatus Faecisoma merdavium]